MKRQVSRRPWIEGGALVGMMIDGQGYRFLRAGVYVSERTGQPCDVAWYRTNCAECETEFELFVKTDAPIFYASRRCSDCARPGLTPSETRVTHEP